MKEALVSKAVSGPASLESNKASDFSPPAEVRAAPIVLTFDVEEHHRIEAAAGLTVDPQLQDDYRYRMKRATEWLLEQLHESRIRATFFILGQIGESHSSLVRSIH